MYSMTRALVMTGGAMTTSTLVTSIVQTMIGMRNRVMPGARILKIVTRKLMPPRIELVPIRMIAAIHRSWPGPGDDSGRRSDNGGELVPPPAPAPPRGREALRDKIPPGGSVHK